jgi:hypothetical protein
MLAAEGFRMPAAAVRHEVVEDAALTVEEPGTGGVPFDAVDARTFGDIGTLDVIRDGEHQAPPHP